jgi:NTE family protein
MCRGDIAGAVQPVAFVDSAGRVPPSRPADPLQYVPAMLDSEHVRASAAIPVLFPPVEIEHPALAGHYVDGGTRLHSPVAPALSLGADRVVVIGFQLFRARVEVPADGVGAPRLADVAVARPASSALAEIACELVRLGTPGGLRPPRKATPCSRSCSSSS